MLNYETLVINLDLRVSFQPLFRIIPATTGKTIEGKNVYDILKLKGLPFPTELIFEIAFAALCFKTKDLYNEVLLDRGLHLNCYDFFHETSPVERND